MRSSGKIYHEKECDKCLISHRYQEKKTGVLLRQKPFFPGFLVQSRLLLGQPWDTMCFVNGFGSVFQNQLTRKNQKKLIKATYPRILALIGCKPNETSQDQPVLSSPPSATWKAETSWVWAWKAWIQMTPWAGQQLLFRLQANVVCEDSEVDVPQLLNVL